jgi:hypothetical protein
MYNLDFETIKQVMQEHQKTGYLYADVPASATSLSEPCRIEARLQAGTVISCFIVGKSGKRLPEKDSVKKINRMGRLQWTFTPHEESAALLEPAPLFMPEEIPVFPRRVAYLEQWQMQSWPRLHRMIFALSDGTRSTAKIAEVLSVPPEQVESALRDLQSINVVAMMP